MHIVAQCTSFNFWVGFGSALAPQLINCTAMGGGGRESELRIEMNLYSFHWMFLFRLLPIPEVFHSLIGVAVLSNICGKY